MEIKIEDYVTTSQIEHAILEQVKESVKSHLKDESNINRIISNSAYNVVSKMVDEVFDEGLEQMLTQNVKGIITKLSHSTVFSAPNAWDREPNSPYKFLQQCFEEMKPRVKSRFTTAVEKGVDAESQKMVKDELHNVFMEWADNKFLSK